MLKKLFLISISLFIFSCSEENYTVSDNEQLSDISQNFSAKEGRLYFKSEEDFVKIYNYKKDNPIAYQSKFNDLYSKEEFISLSPSYSSEEDLNLYSSKINSSVQSKTNSVNTTDPEVLDNIDDLEDYFGEDAFSNFLNQNAELIIADQLYKYTDVGLFIVDFENKDALYQYLDSKNIKPDLLNNSESTIQNFIVNNNFSNGLTVIDPTNDLSIYIPDASTAYIQPCDGEYGCGSGGGGNYGGGTTQPTNPDNIALISSNLPLCNPSKGLLGSIMGNVKVCIDKYSNDRRVKTKYYDIDLKLVYATGIKVKHQKKGWTGIWSRTDASKVALGINSITWSFEPDFSYGRPAGVRMFVSEGRMYESYQSFLNIIYQKNIPMPELPFHKGKAVQAIIEFSIDNNIATEVELQNFFYGQLYDKLNNILKSAHNKSLQHFTVVASTPGGRWIQYYNLDKVCENCDRKEDVIDWGAVTPEFTYNFGTGSNSGFKVTSWNYDFKKAKLINLKSYGMAKVNNTWKGHRLEF